MQALRSAPPASAAVRPRPRATQRAARAQGAPRPEPAHEATRRSAVLAPPLALLAAALAPAGPAHAAASAAALATARSNANSATNNGFEFMPALGNADYGKPKNIYPDFTLTASGLQFKDFREGSGAMPRTGQRVILDWDGYTAGYYGRPFEARNKAKGGAFTGDNKEYFRFILGSPDVIGAFNEAVAGMKPGGIRRVIVSPGPLFYPLDKPRSQGPRPSTFSGERALYFVLENQGLIDKTLLFDIELIRVENA